MTVIVIGFASTFTKCFTPIIFSEEVAAVDLRRGTNTRLAQWRSGKAVDLLDQQVMGSVPQDKAP